MLILIHALTFPGVFAPGGLLGAGPQTTAWLYVFWHGGFALGVLLYAVIARNEAAKVAAPRRGPHRRDRRHNCGCRRIGSLFDSRSPLPPADYGWPALHDGDHKRHQPLHLPDQPDCFVSFVEGPEALDPRSLADRSDVRLALRRVAGRHRRQQQIRPRLVRRSHLFIPCVQPPVDHDADRIEQDPRTDGPCRIASGKLPVRSRHQH